MAGVQESLGLLHVKGADSNEADDGQGAFELMAGLPLKSLEGKGRQHKQRALLQLLDAVREAIEWRDAAGSTATCPDCRAQFSQPGFDAGALGGHPLGCGSAADEDSDTEGSCAELRHIPLPVLEAVQAKLLLHLLDAAPAQVLQWRGGHGRY
jgi:hypothetical protein